MFSGERETERKRERERDRETERQRRRNMIEEGETGYKGNRKTG